MADQVNINHAFVSAKVDSGDNSIVSSSEWNDDLLISGGQDGQPILRDSSKLSGARWGQGQIIRAATVNNYTGVSPSPYFGAITVTLQNNAFVMLMAVLGCTIVSGTAYRVHIRRNGVEIVSFVYPATGVQHVIPTIDISAVVGANVYDFSCETDGAVAFTALNGSFTAFVLGSII